MVSKIHGSLGPVSQEEQDKGKKELDERIRNFAALLNDTVLPEDHEAQGLRLLRANTVSLIVRSPRRQSENASPRVKNQTFSGKHHALVSQIIPEESIRRFQNLMFLRSIDEALKVTPHIGSEKLCWSEGFGLLILDGRQGTKEETQKVFKLVISKFIEALNFDSQAFLTTLGNRVELKDLFERFSKAVCDVKDLKEKFYSIQLKLLDNTLTSITTQENPSGLIATESPKLSAPLKQEDQSQKRSLCFELLTRLDFHTPIEHKEKAEHLHPMTFLCTYQKFFSTKVLFSEMKKALSLPDEVFSLEQQIRVIKCCKLWVESGLYFKGLHLPGVRRGLDKVIQLGRFHKSPEIRSVAEQLYLLLDDHLSELPQVSLNGGQKAFIQSVNSCLKMKKTSSAYRRAFKAIVDDLYLCSAQFLLSFEGHELISDPKKKLSSEVPSGFSTVDALFNHLTNFVTVTILSPIKYLSTSQAKIEKKKEQAASQVRKRYLFFLDVAKQLLERKDFFGAYAVFAGLSRPSVSRLFTKPNTYTDEKGEVCTEVLWTDNKIPAFSIEKLNFLETLFNPKGFFRELRKTIAAIEGKHQLYLPFLPMYVGDITRIDENNQDFSGDSFVPNFDKLEMLASPCISVLRAQRRLAYEIRRTDGIGPPHTNLRDFLENPFSLKEGYDYQLSLRLKPLLK